MSETTTHFTNDQITAYEEMYNLNPANNRAIVINMMRLEGMIQELQAEISLMSGLEKKIDKAYKAIERLGAFAMTSNCDIWQLCRLDIDKLKDYEKDDLFKV